MKFQKQDQF